MNVSINKTEPGIWYALTEKATDCCVSLYGLRSKAYSEAQLRFEETGVEYYVKLINENEPTSPSPS